MEDLLTSLTAFIAEEQRRDRKWPRSPEALRAKLQRLEATMFKVGIEIEFERSTRRGVKITYRPSDSGQGWAGLYWLDPRSNWGYSPGGYNLTGLKRLTFWARGAEGGEKISVFKVGGILGPYADSVNASIGPIWLTREWRQYVIDLRDADLAKVSGGFAWSANANDNLGALTFYVDEIRFER